MIDPEKLIEPMIAVNIVARVKSNANGAPCAVASVFINSPIATSDAAPPPQPLKIATIWGMAVIFTARPE